MFCCSCGTAILPEANYCHECGSSISQSDEDLDNNLPNIIEGYFNRGYQYTAIIGLLEKYHGVKIHIRTLKRKLREYGLRRRESNYDEATVREIIKKEMQDAGKLGGYRYMWHALRLRHHICIPRRVVATIMKEIDPDGVRNRRARRLTRRNFISFGPNFTWHIDGYDKLKPYGFPIHGCICGFSRRIIWLQLVKSNNNPKVIAQLYLDTVKSLKGCPQILRSDCGTENVIVAGMQAYFRAMGNDEFSGEKSHQYGSSPSNQRIEGWWSFLRRSNSGWWINLFKDMCDAGLLELGNEFQMHCLWFCYSKLIQDELDKVKDQWNSHYIRRSRHDTVPGVPDILYYLPEQSGSLDCLFSVSQEKIAEVEEQCEQDAIDNPYSEYFEHVLEMQNLQYPSSTDDAFELFQLFKDLQGN